MWKEYFPGIRFFVCLLFVTDGLYAIDYIIYKSNGDGYAEPSEQEYRQAFDVISKYKFPMILDKKNRHLKDALSEDEMEELVTNERNFLEKKIGLKDIKLEGIPTILYEILYFFCYFQEINENIDTWKSEHALWLSDRCSGFYVLKNSPEDILMNCKKVGFGLDISLLRCDNNIELESFFHYWLNNKILPIMRCHGLYQTNKDTWREKAIPGLVEDIIWNNKEILKKADEHIRFGLHLDVLQDLSEKHILFFQTIMHIENEALQQNAIPLFRGTGGTKNYIDWFEKEFGYLGLSYGISFFAGVFADPGACVYSYLNKPSTKYVYAWLVDKKSCMDQKSIISNLWLHDLPNSWRTIDTIKALISSGEDFHPRVILRENTYEQLASFGYTHEAVVEACKNFLRNDIRLIKWSDTKFFKYNEANGTWSTCGIIENISKQNETEDTE